MVYLLLQVRVVGVALVDFFVGFASNKFSWTVEEATTMMMRMIAMMIAIAIEIVIVIVIAMNYRRKMKACSSCCFPTHFEIYRRW